MPSVCIRKLIVLRGLVLHGLTAVHSVLQALLLLVEVNSNQIITVYTIPYKFSLEFTYYIRYFINMEIAVEHLSGNSFTMHYIRQRGNR